VFLNPIPILARLPPVVRLLIAGTFVNKMGSFILPFLTIVLRREYELTEGQVGWLLLAYGAGSLVSVLAGGALTDRLGRRFTLLLSLGGSGVIALALGFAGSIRTFVPLLVLFGFMADLYRPASSSIIGDVLPSSQRASGFAGLRLAINLGFAAGMSLGGFLADWNWRLLFIGDGLTTLGFAAVVYLFIGETRPAAAPVRGDAPPRSDTSLWRDVVFLQLMATSFAFAMVFFNHVSTLAVTVTGTAGYPARVFGGLVAVNGLVVALFEMGTIEQLKRFRRLRLAAAGTLLGGLGFGLTGMVMDWRWFLLTVVMWSVGEILCLPFTMAFLTDWAPPTWRGRYLSWYSATWSMAIGLNPILFLPVQARLGDRAFWPLMFLIAVPAAWVLLRLDRVADRPERLRGVSGDPVPLSVPAVGLGSEVV
jgi:MFS family permease